MTEEYIRKSDLKEWMKKWFCYDEEPEEAGGAPFPNLYAKLPSVPAIEISKPEDIAEGLNREHASNCTWLDFMDAGTCCCGAKEYNQALSDLVRAIKEYKEEK